MAALVTRLDVYEQRAALDRLTVARVLRPVRSLCANSSLQEALRLVSQAAVEAVPVVEGRRLLGLLTWPALLQAAETELAAA
jgi:CBS domain-containing protein